MLQFGKKIPIAIKPFFWVTALFIGWISGTTFAEMVVWAVVVFVSVLVHELGHALMALFFKQKPKIELVAMGGVTYYESGSLKFYQQFLITFCGPLFGFLLFLVSALLLQFVKEPGLVMVLNSFRWINLFWTFVNLLPILPLDGGQLLRISLEGFFGFKGFKWALFISMLIAISLGVVSLFFGGIIFSAFFFLFAFQSFEAWRRSKFLKEADRNSSVALLLKKGEDAFLRGDKEGAKTIFEEVRKTTHEGIFYGAATYYIALIDTEEGKGHESYELLLTVKDQLSSEAKPLFQKLAFEEKNYNLVAELASKSFEAEPTKEVALRNSKAFAYLGQAKPSLGWLKQAFKLEHFDLQSIISEDIFDRIRDDPEVKNFIHHLF